MNLVIKKKNTWKEFQTVPFSSLTSKILCERRFLESDAEIQFHGEKYFQENLIVLLSFFSL